MPAVKTNPSVRNAKSRCRSGRSAGSSSLCLNFANYFHYTPAGLSYQTSSSLPPQTLQPRASQSPPNPNRPHNHHGHSSIPSPPAAHLPPYYPARRARAPSGSHAPSSASITRAPRSAPILAPAPRRRLRCSRRLEQRRLPSSKRCLSSCRRCARQGDDEGEERGEDEGAGREFEDQHRGRCQGSFLGRPWTGYRSWGTGFGAAGEGCARKGRL